MNYILIVDDDELTLQLYELMFEEEENLNLKKVTSGTEALSYLQSCPENQWPAYVFIDLHMPDMNGFEFVGAFSKYFEDRLANTRLYILTSSVSPRDEEEARSYTAISGLISKPLTEENLQKVLNTE